MEKPRMEVMKNSNVELPLNYSLQIDIDLISDLRFYTDLRTQKLYWATKSLKVISRWTVSKAHWAGRTF